MFFGVLTKIHMVEKNVFKLQQVFNIIMLYDYMKKKLQLKIAKVKDWNQSSSKSFLENRPGFKNINLNERETIYSYKITLLKYGSNFNNKPLFVGTWSW